MTTTVVAVQKNPYWSKLGIWQVLAACLTLVSFFVTLHITGDKKAASIFAVVVGILAGFLASSSMIASFVFITTFTAAFAAFAISLANHAISSAAFVTTLMVGVASATASIAFVALTYDEAKDYSISKRVVWLSCTAEFVAVFLPMLLA